MGAASTANLRFNGRGLPSQVQALALLVPLQRRYSTDPSTSTSSSSESFLPPGYNAEQAKKPIQKEDESQSKDSQQVEKAKPESSTAVQNNADAKDSGDNNNKVAVAEDEKKVSEKREQQKKLTVGQKIKKEVQHYWDGTKLLATEVKISSRLALKMARGYELTRREQRQVG